MNFISDGYNLLREFEGLKLTSYQDQGGVWTAGYGHTSGVTEGITISKALAEVWLIEDVSSACVQLNSVLKTQLNDFQYTACGCFIFNLGIGNFESSTLLKCLNTGDVQSAAEQFVRWCKVKGIPNPGLLRRRLAEQALFLRQS